MEEGKWWIETPAPSGTARDFIQLLSPTHGKLKSSYLPSNLAIYRGLGSADYSLLPAAFRKGYLLIDKVRWRQTPRKTNRQQIQAELSTLLSFLDIVDRRGYPVPEDSYDLRKDLRDQVDLLTSSSEPFAVWPDSRLFSLMALAQHYSVPTRLLDWTTDPYVAAYFAAISAIGASSPRSHLCVWSLLQAIDLVGDVLMPDRPIKVITAPGAHNPNLRAQRGVFLGWEDTNIDLDKDFVPESYDQVIARNMPWLEESKTKFLYKFTLAVEQAPELLRLLSVHGVDASTIYPSLEGAAKAVLERRHWPDVDTWSNED